VCVCARVDYTSRYDCPPGRGEDRNPYLRFENSFSICDDKTVMKVMAGGEHPQLDVGFEPRWVLRFQTFWLAVVRVGKIRTGPGRTRNQAPPNGRSAPLS
jgi:hypothetical protein